MKIAVIFVFTLFAMVFSDCNGGGQPTPTPTPAPTPTPPPPHQVVIEKELMITDLAVVNSTEATSEGAFSIKTILSNMALNGQTAKEMMLSLLTSWESPQTVNTFQIPARQTIRSRIIDPWKSKDGAAGKPDAEWNMNFANAPFRLLAVVNRIDLHRKEGAVVKNAGEGRFVFGVLDPTGGPLLFTVIFEFEQKATSEAELKAWADEWHNLGTFPAFDANYLTALKAVTAKFSGKGVMPGKPNDSALNQLRTNEIALSAPWELREFNISASTGTFEPATTKQTPHHSFNNSPRLADYVLAHQTEIESGSDVVPLEFPPGQPFMSGNAHVPPPTGAGFWDAPGLTNDVAEFKFSVATCSACHGRETQTQFTHVKPRPQGQAAELSGFLTGITVTDPRNAATQHEFNDLRDRALILNFLTGATVPSSTIDSILADRAKRVH
ncbi:MAG: hypothetical protein ABL984_09405 [Pyrinomonadaceae bacterium]